jgi:hypothetical protein
MAGVGGVVGAEEAAGWYHFLFFLAAPSGVGDLAWSPGTDKNTASGARLFTEVNGAMVAAISSFKSVNG